jgi:hypothetical protein
LDYRYVTKNRPNPPPSGDAWRRGRKPRGERALTGAEPQARYRQPPNQRPRCGAPAPLPAPPRPFRRPNRPQRWRAAVAELLVLQTEYAVWLDSLPEGLRNDATDEALQAIIDLDLDERIAIELPRGFGQD